MWNRDRLLRLLAIGIGQHELHVDCIGMPQRDRRLKPLEQDLPFAAKRIGPRLEFAKVEHETLFYNERRNQESKNSRIQECQQRTHRFAILEFLNSRILEFSYSVFCVLSSLCSPPNSSPLANFASPNNRCPIPAP